MEKIGKQVRLPFATAFQIAMQGIKIRLGRALVTISGVVLGIAFLMNVLTGTLITHSISHENELRQKVGKMMAQLLSNVGDVDGKTIAVAEIGTLSEAETTFTAQLSQHATLRVQTSNLERIGHDADLLLILGNGACPLPLAALTAGLRQPIVIDATEQRTFAGQPAPAKARDLFFAGQQEALANQAKAEDQARFRTFWIAIISLLVTVIGIANALLMSVTERFKEIGTMKCLGALSVFIRQLFLIESAVIGIVGSFLGCIIGIIFPLLAYSFAYSFHIVLGAMNYGQLFLMALGCLVAGSVLSILAALYPAIIAARMIPAMALRSNV